MIKNLSSWKSEIMMAWHLLLHLVAHMPRSGHVHLYTLTSVLNSTRRTFSIVASALSILIDVPWL